MVENRRVPPVVRKAPPPTHPPKQRGRTPARRGARGNQSARGLAAHAHARWRATHAAAHDARWNAARGDGAAVWPIERPHANERAACRRRARAHVLHGVGDDEVDVGGPISPFSPDRRDDDRSDDDLSCNCFISKMVITDDEENNVQGEMQF